MISPSAALPEPAFIALLPPDLAARLRTTDKRGLVGWQTIDPTALQIELLARLLKVLTPASPAP